MHEARKGNCYITATPITISAKTGLIFLNEKGEKIKIHRTVLHYRLKKYVEDYSNELRNLSQEGKNLRRFLARKMDDLFDYPSKPEDYEWWIAQ